MGRASRPEALASATLGLPVSLSFEETDTREDQK